MALHKTCTDSRGFTLIEILIALGMFAVVLACSLLLDVSSYQGDAFRREHTTLATLLQKARADALANIGHTAHGVALFPADHPEAYVLFAGDSYASSEASTREVVSRSYHVELGPGTPGEVVFAARSAITSEAALVLIDSVRQASSTIFINTEGMIDW